MLSQRRNHRIATLEQARRNGLLKFAEANDIVVPEGEKSVTMAADELLGLMRSSRIGREQVEREQSADNDRLTGWRVVAPGLNNADAMNRMNALLYRMAVRAKALDAFHKFDIANMLSTTGRTGRVANPTAPRAPWRPGAASM